MTITAHGLLWTIVALVAGLILSLIAVVCFLPAIASLFHVTVRKDVLTNGSQQVELQGMIHIATPEFYDQVRRLIERRTAEGWLVLYEGVVYDGPPELKRETDAKLWKRLGLNVVYDQDEQRSVYALLSPMLGRNLRAQDNKDLGLISGPAIINADVTTSQILAHVPEAEHEPEKLDLSDLRRKYDELPVWLQERMSAFIRIFFSAKLRDKGKSKLPEFILTGREAVVLDRLAQHPNDNILIIYGDNHRPRIGAKLAEAGFDLTESAELRTW